MKILRHILCSRIILNISEPVVYVKTLMLFRRLKNYTEDEVAKASLISTASRIKPPQKLASWLSSLEISVDVSKSIVDQLFKKNSKQVFQNFYRVLIDSENSGSNNKEKGSTFKKKSDKNESGNEKEEENLLKVAVGIIDTPNKDINCNFQTIDKINIDGENNQIKKVLHLPKLCNQIKNSKKKKKNHATNKSINLVNTESNTKSTMQLVNTKTVNLIKTSLDSQNNSTKLKKTKKKKKPKAKTGYIETTLTSKNNDTKSIETSNNKKSGSKGKKPKKKKKTKEINNSINEIPFCKKSDSLNLEIHSNEAHLSTNGDSVLINNKLLNHEGTNQRFKDANDSSLSKNNLIIDEKKSNDEENSAIKKLRLTQSAIENQISQTDKERYNVCLEKSNDKISNRNDLSSKLPNLLANYEIYSSADESETAKKDVSSCPLMESGDNVLVPDTCQNDFNSIVPFNLDSWIPSKDDTSISNDDSLNSDKYPFDSLNVIKRTDTCRDNQSDNLSFSDSAFEYINDSEVSRDTFVSNDGSQISDKYPYVPLIDIRKNKKWRSYQNSNYSNSSFDDSVTGNIKDSEVSQDTCISYDGSQISDKIPFVSLVDIKKMKNRNLYEKSSCSNSSYNSSCVEKINVSETSQNDCISSEESQISNKNPNNIKKVDKIDNHNDLNYDPILGNLNSKEIIDTSNQNPDNSLCHDSYTSENRKDKSPSIQGKNRNVGNENKVSELPPDEILVQSKQFHENQSPCEKHSKTGTQSMEQDLVRTNLKTKTNSPITRLRKQTNYNTRKKQGKRKCSSDNIKDLVQPQEEEKCCQELETSATDANGDVYMNDLSTLLPNHGDIETQENETTSPSTDIALNNSDTQDLSQYQEYANCKEPNILSHELNGKQSASLIFQANAKQQPCVTFPNANHQSDIPTCSIETVIDEFLESELSKVHGSCNNLNPGRLSDNVTEKTHAGSVHSVDKNAYSPFQTNSDLVPSDCFSYKSNLNPSPQNNNQSNILSVSSSSALENRSIENEVARSLLNLSVNENPQLVALPTNPDHRKENTNPVIANLHPGNSTYIVDCNIINDFDSRNSSRAGSSVSGDTTTIKVVLNLINAKPENSSSPQNPNSLGNTFLAASNSSQGLHSSVASGQVMNNSNCSFPMHRNNSYSSAPPFFSRTVNELDTPPDSERHLRMPSIPTVKNTVSPCSEDKANFMSSSKSNGRSSTPKSLSRKRQRKEFSHSSESTNEWGISKLDLNSPFSDIRPLQCEDAMSTLNVRQKRNNNSAKDKQNKKSISRTADHSMPNGKKTAFPYRNSRPSIYSDESEDDLSVSTMSLLSGEETDHSLLKTTDNEISPKSPLHNENISSKNKQWTSNTLTDGSFIKSVDNKISTKSPLHRKNNNTRNKTKKLFQEEKWALDSLTIESPVNEPSTVLGQPTAQKKRKPIKVTKTVKKPKTSLKRDYNLRSRPLLTPPAKLMSYIT
ncbi:unnamed protein product [Larinioides sclopetarius]